MRTETILAEYADHRYRQGRALSPKTMQGYRDAFAHLGAYYLPSSQRLEAVETRLFGLSPQTQATYIRRWKTIGRFASETHGIRSPFTQLESRPALPKISRVFTPQEYARLSAACNGAADMVLLDLLMGTGIRVGEIPLYEWQIGPDFITVDGKTGPRFVAIHPRERSALLDTSINGRLWFGRLSIPGLVTRWRRLVARAGITGAKRGPHTARRTFASTWIANGGSIESLKAQLGHRSVRTTEIYVAASPGWVTRHLQGNDPLGSIKSTPNASGEPQKTPETPPPAQENSSYADAA